jgi:protoporphyrinogen oxidase
MMSGKKLMGLSEGLATLPRKLSEGKEIQYATQVVSVSGNIVQTSKGAVKGNHLIVATPPSVARILLGKVFPREIEVPSSPSVHEAILLRKSKRNGTYGTLITPGKNPDINVITNERMKAPGLAPEEFDLYGVLYSREGAKKEKSLSEIPGLKSEDILERKRTVWKEAIPVLSPGHFKAISDYRKSLSHESPVLLCGDYLSTGCAEGAVESGQFVAGLFASRL